MELDNTSLETGEPALSELTPGKKLKAERERLGIPCEEIAMRLRLRVGVIEALERDDYREMAADVFMKGYLRSYARLLSIEPEGLMQAFDALDVDRKPRPATSHIWQNMSPSEKKEKPFKAMLMMSSGFAVLILAIWFGNHLLFNKTKKAMSTDTISMNVLGTKDLALTDISTLQVKKPASSQNAMNKKPSVNKKSKV